GSGGGIDVLLSAKRVGQTGKAYGLDMTDGMLDLARENQRKAGVANVEFLKGEIEHIPLPDASVDVIISNCVINLSADKRQVLREAFRVLKPGGRFAVSDVVVRGDVPAAVRSSMELWVGCVAGALAEAEYRRLLAGTVVATESGAPLVGASVVVVGTARSVLTNEKGQYHLSVPAGAHSVRARLIGYEAAEERVVVPAGQTVTVDFKLTATPLSLNEIVVVGARTSRTAVETPVPVDVITSQEVQETGHTEVNQILATLAPSFNASHQTIADGSDHINPASLRGLGPDQVLVLVNGKRRHSSALVHVN